MEHEDAEGKVHECKEETRIDVKCDQFRDKLIRMKTEFEFLQDGHISLIPVAKHSIEII